MEVDQGEKADAQDEDLQGQDKWFCSEAQALPVVVESLDVFAAHLTSKVTPLYVASSAVLHRPMSLFCKPASVQPSHNSDRSHGIPVWVLCH